MIICIIFVSSEVDRFICFAIFNHFLDCTNSTYFHVQARVDAKLYGIREKKAKEAAENPEYAKKLAAEKAAKKKKK